MVIHALARRARAWWTDTYSQRERRWLTVIVPMLGEQVHAPEP